LIVVMEMDYIVQQDGRVLRDVLRRDMGVSYSSMKSAKWDGRILVDGVSVPVNTVLRQGQVVTMLWPQEKPVYQLKPYALELKIAYEDEHLMVIDKPAPLAMTPMPVQQTGTLANRAAFYAGEDKFIFRPVNRLDKGTSGLLVAAKHALAQKKLTDILHTDEFIREYEALAEGVLEDDLIIDAPIERMDGDPVRRCVRQDGPANSAVHRHR
jgi:23S rRNA pseudouridine1911/1915/1917 synthase